MMHHAISVSLFPEPPSPQRTHHTPRGQTNSSTRSECLTTTFHNNVTSVDRTVDQSQVDGYLLNSPESPLVFRQFTDTMYNWDQHASGSVELSSPSSRFAASLGTRKPTPSTKDSIASLGISASCPAPSYRFLLPSPRPAADTSRDPPRPTLAPRSISLPVYTLSKLGVDVMPRPASPAWSVAADELPKERMTFSPRDLTEPAYGSVAKSSHPGSPASSTSSLSLWRGRKLWNGTRSELSSPRSLSPSSSYNHLPPTNIRVPSEDLAALYASSLTFGGGFSGYFAPTPMPPPRTPRPKPPLPVGSSADADSAPSPPSDKEPKLSMKRVRRLISRRSISSFDALAESGTGDQGESASPLVTPTSEYERRLSADADPSGDRPDIQVFVPDTGSDSPRIYTHFVVGDVWEECDVSEIIPILRSMKFAGK